MILLDCLFRLAQAHPQAAATIVTLALTAAVLGRRIEVRIVTNNFGGPGRNRPI